MRILALLDEEGFLSRTWPVLERLPEKGDRVWPHGNHRFATVLETSPDPIFRTTNAHVLCDCVTEFTMPARHVFVLGGLIPVTTEALDSDLEATSHGVDVSAHRLHHYVHIREPRLGIKAMLSEPVRGGFDGFLYHDERVPK